jgi:hypothetical protein
MRIFDISNCNYSHNLLPYSKFGITEWMKKIMFDLITFGRILFSAKGRLRRYQPSTTIPRNIVPEPLS